jgi:hypothetical protein
MARRWLDEMDPVNPAAKLVLDPELLGRFPEGIGICPTCRPGSATPSSSTFRS